MKKIGIFTWFNVQNYGTALQAFALYTFLAKKNEVYLVDYFDTKKISRLSYRIKLCVKYFLAPILKIRDCFLSGNFIKGVKISRCYRNIKIYRCAFTKKISSLEKIRYSTYRQ